MLHNQYFEPVEIALKARRRHVARLNLTVLAFCHYLRTHHLHPFHSPLVGAADFETVAYTLAYDVKKQLDPPVKPGELTTFSELKKYLDHLSMPAQSWRGTAPVVDPQLTPHYIRDGKPTALESRSLNAHYMPLFSGLDNPTDVDRFLKRFAYAMGPDPKETRRNFLDDQRVYRDTLNLLIPQSSIVIRHQLLAGTHDRIVEPDYYTRRHNIRPWKRGSPNLATLGNEIVAGDRALDFDLAMSSNHYRSRVLCTRWQNRSVLGEYFLALQPNLSYDEFPLDFLSTLGHDPSITTFSSAYRAIHDHLSPYLATHQARSAETYWSIPSLGNPLSKALFEAFTTHDGAKIVHPITEWDPHEPERSLEVLANLGQKHYRGIGLPIGTDAYRFHLDAAPAKSKWIMPPITPTMMCSTQWVTINHVDKLENVDPAAFKKARGQRVATRNHNDAIRAHGGRVKAPPRKRCLLPVSVMHCTLQSTAPQRVTSDPSDRRQFNLWSYDEPYSGYRGPSLELMDPLLRLKSLGVPDTVMHPALRKKTVVPQ